MHAEYELLAEFFKALAHPARLQILDMLRGGELCVCHIETALLKRQAYVSQQLMELREAGLVTSRKEGLQVYYSLGDPRVADVLDRVCGAAQPRSAFLEGCPCPNCTVIAISNIS